MEAHPIAVDLFELETIRCPFPAYRELRDRAPVWKDPRTGAYLVSRYEDCRAIALDAARYPNGLGNSEASKLLDDDLELAQSFAALDAELDAIYEHHGWVPGPTLNGRDGEEHRQLRKLFDYAFRPNRLRVLEPIMQQAVNDLLDDFIETGRCNWTTEFCEPLPMTVLAHFVGLPVEDMARVKPWTAAWIERMSLMQSADGRRRSTELEVEAQHYLYEKIDEVRAHPRATLLSELVNSEVPGWDRRLNDNELLAHLMTDLFVAGAETTTHALANGMMLLVDQPGLWAKLKAQPDRYMDVWVEEALRLEGPVQGQFRTVSRDVELHGVTIPAGATVMLRYASANRDERHYDVAEAVDLDRANPRGHLAFSVGKHHCIGAPLARRELHITWSAVVERLQDVRFAESSDDVAVQPNYFLRCLGDLHLEFTPGGRLDGDATF